MGLGMLLGILRMPVTMEDGVSFAGQIHSNQFIQAAREAADVIEELSGKLGAVEALADRWRNDADECRGMKGEYWLREHSRELFEILDGTG